MPPFHGIVYTAVDKRYHEDLHSALKDGKIYAKIKTEKRGEENEKLLLKSDSAGKPPGGSENSGRLCRDSETPKT